MRGTMKEIDALIGINDLNITRGIIHFLVKCGAMVEVGTQPRADNKGRAAALYEMQPNAAERVLSALRLSK